MNVSEWNVTMNVTFAEQFFTVEAAKEQLRRFGYLFYLVDPKSTKFERPEDVPNYIDLVSLQILGFQIILHFLHNF